MTVFPMHDYVHNAWLTRNNNKKPDVTQHLNFSYRVNVILLRDDETETVRNNFQSIFIRAFCISMLKVTIFSSLLQIRFVNNADAFNQCLLQFFTKGWFLPVYFIIKESSEMQVSSWQTWRPIKIRSSVKYAILER